MRLYNKLGIRNFAKQVYQSKDNQDIKYTQKTNNMEIYSENAISILYILNMIYSNILVSPVLNRDPHTYNAVCTTNEATIYNIHFICSKYKKQSLQVYLCLTFISFFQDNTALQT